MRREGGVVPLTLSTVRESRKLSQTALAKAAGVTQPAISQYETGRMLPSDDVVRRLSAALRCPPTLLHQEMRFRQLPLTFFRRRSRVSMKTLNAIRARVNLYTWRLGILLRSYAPPDTRVTISNTDDDASATVAAQRLRVYWGLPQGPVPDVTALVESRGIIVIPINFDTDYVDGLSLYEPRDSMPPLIFVSRAVTADRWRMNIVHELAHIVLHHHRNIPFDDARTEAEAFEFAAEFLMPRRDIRGHLRYLDMHSLAGLKEHWRVSMAALLKRSVDFGYTSNRKARSFWVQLRRGGAEIEPVSISPEQPSILRKLVEYHTNTLGHSPETFATLIHQDPEEVADDWGVGRFHLQLT